jgi:hypothetical protein
MAKELTIKYEGQDMENKPVQEMNQIFGMIKSITTAPTGSPTKMIDQIVIDTTNARLYIYDTVTRTWKYSSLT